MGSTKNQHAIIFLVLIITSCLAGCVGNDEENNVISDYKNDIVERDQKIETLEAEIANLTFNVTATLEAEIANLTTDVTDLTGEIASLEEQYSLLLMRYNHSVLHSENLSSQLIYCEFVIGPQPPNCYDAEEWYYEWHHEYSIREEVEQNLTYALETIQEMESLVVHIIGANLSGADLYGADLSDSVIINSNLSGADLRWAWLTNSNLSGSDLSYAQLDFIDFGYAANLSNVSFRGVDLVNVEFNWRISFHGVDFSDSILGDFETPVFNHVNFSGADFTQSDILSGSFDFVDLTYSNGLAWVSDGAYFENSDLTGATNAVPHNSYWFNTICPDGTNSDDNGDTCEGHGI